MWTFCELKTHLVGLIRASLGVIEQHLVEHLVDLGARGTTVFAAFNYPFLKRDLKSRQSDTGKNKYLLQFSGAQSILVEP